jgi:membrane protease YdiL (CAAX protease family)
MESILACACIEALFMAMFTADELLFGVLGMANNHWAFGTLFGELPKFMLCSTAIGIFEEILSRGAIVRAFYTAFNPILAIVISSLFFAYEHMKIPLAANLTDDISAFSGFRYLIPM